MKIQTNSVDNYKKVKELLDKHNIRVRHTYKLPEEKLYRVVLRNLHYSTDHNAIKTALHEKGHNVVHIMNVQNRVTKDPKNLFFLDLERKSNNGEIYNVNTLLHAVVRFETPNKKQTIVQCKRCQNYGHTRNQCTQQFRCVKCAGTHDYRLCAKKKEDGKPAKCALCGGAHPANFKGCQVYLDIVSKRFPTHNGSALRQHTYAQVTSQQLTPRNNNTQLSHPPNDHSLQNTSQPLPGGITYASVAATQTNQNSTLPTQSTINHQFLTFLQQQNTYLQQQNMQLHQQIDKQQQAILELTQEIRQLKDEIQQNMRSQK